MNDARLKTEPVIPITILQRVHHASRSIAAAASQNEIAQALMEFAALADVDVARLLVCTRSLDGQRPSFEVRDSWTADSRPVEPYGTRLPSARIPLLALIESEAIFVCKDIRSDERLTETIREWIKRYRLCSFALIPLASQESPPGQGTSGPRNLLGTLMIGRDTPSVLDEQAIFAWWTVTIQAAAAWNQLQFREQMQRHDLQLQTAAEIARAASSILDPDALIQQVVDLVRQRFDLYYAGLFLVDHSGDLTGEPGRWAVLRAGTGEPGHIQRQQGHRLEVGSESMIGWCVANAQARIALDVALEDTRFVNPLLPATRSEMALPLISRGQVIGAMTIQSSQPAAFSQDDISALQTMADHVANAIQNARLFEEHFQRTEELATLNLIASTVSRSLELQQLLDRSLDVILKAMDFDAGLISLFDVESAELRMASQSSLPVSLVRLFEQSGLKGTLCEAVFQASEPMGIGDVRKGAPIDVQGLIRSGLYAYAGAPLVHQDAALGTICIFCRSARNLDSAQLAVLEAAGRQIGLGIQNSRLFAQARDRAEELSVLNELAQTFATNLDVEEVLDEIHHGVSRLLPAENFFVGLYDAASNEVQIRLNVTESTIDRKVSAIPADRGITGYIIQHRTGVLVQENISEWMAENGIASIGQPAASWLGAPLLVGDQVLGVMAVQDYVIPRLYSESHLDLFVAIANQAAVALQNARLFQEAQSALREVETIHRRYLRQEYDNLISSGPQHPLGYLDGPDGLIPADDFWGPEIEQVVETGELVVFDAPDGKTDRTENNVLAVPIKLRDQIIGVLDFYSADRSWTDEEKSLAMAVADQVSLALENARLFEKTQRSASRERLTGAIVSKIRSAGDIERILETAANELGRALGVTHTRVQLGSLSSDGKHARTDDLADGQAQKANRPSEEA
jgi:GAF domain-containing protein